MKPSITKLIEMLDKPALLKWANKIGLQGISIDDYRNEAKQKGTDYHLAVETYLKFKIESSDEVFNEKMKQFFKDKEVISVEQVIVNDYFTGRYDIKFKYNDFTFIGDFKSSQKGVYFENRLQLAGYTLSEKDCYACIIHLPEFVFHPVTFDNDLYHKFLITLSELYELKAKIDQTK
jgi:hypothetical protein